MAKAIYYNENLKGKSFEVLKEYPAPKDGVKTVDLGVGDKLAVGKCQVSIEPKVGHAVLEAEPVEESAPDEGKSEGGEKGPKKEKAKA